MNSTVKDSLNEPKNGRPNGELAFKGVYRGVCVGACLKRTGAEDALCCQYVRLTRKSCAGTCRDYTLNAEALILSPKPSPVRDLAKPSFGFGE